MLMHGRMRILTTTMVSVRIPRVCVRHSIDSFIITSNSVRKCVSYLGLLDLFVIYCFLFFLPEKLSYIVNVESCSFHLINIVTLYGKLSNSIMCSPYLGSCTS